TPSQQTSRCRSCGEACFKCRACGATARALARFCRACRKDLESDWAVEHPGLKQRSRSTAIDSSNTNLTHTPDWQLSFGVEMLSPPLAARGIAAFPLRDGTIVIVDEADGRNRAELKTGSQISFTPVIIDNLLVAATESEMIAYDLIAALYGEMAKGNPIS